jgi:hypothetical protein
MKHADDYDLWTGKLAIYERLQFIACIQGSELSDTVEILCRGSACDRFASAHGAFQAHVHISQAPGWSSMVLE